MKGWIALDIDGTITHKMYEVPSKISSYLRKLKKSGWNILIVTGRSLHDSENMISSFNFPFVFSSLNGSIAWEMPKRKQIFKNFLKKEHIVSVEKKVDHKKILFSAFGNDSIMYRKKRSIFSKKFLYGKKIEYLDDFQKHFVEEYPIIKCMGLKDDVILLKEKLKNLDLEISFVKDPFNEGYGILLMTKKDVNKGSCIKKILEIYGDAFVIAAGNDNNDLPMFSFADIKIAMEDSPSDHLLKKADIIAASAKKNGIIKALEKAISNGIIFK